MHVYKIQAAFFVCISKIEVDEYTATSSFLCNACVHVCVWWKCVHSILWNTMFKVCTGYAMSHSYSKYVKSYGMHVIVLCWCSDTDGLYALAMALNDTLMNNTHLKWIQQRFHHTKIKKNTNCTWAKTNMQNEPAYKRAHTVNVLLSKFSGTNLSTNLFIFNGRKFVCLIISFGFIKLGYFVKQLANKMLFVCLKYTTE